MRVGIVVLALFIVLASATDDHLLGTNDYTKDTCLVWGDPHYTTFDNFAYTYMNTPNTWAYLLVSPHISVISSTIPFSNNPAAMCIDKVRIYTKSAEGDVTGIELGINDEKRGTAAGTGTWAYATDLTTGKSIPDLLPANKADTSGSIKLSATTTARFTVINGFYTVKVSYSDGTADSKATVSYSYRAVVVNPSTEMYKDTCGLCGTWNKDSSNDFFLPDYTTVKTDQLEKFNVAWKLSAAPALDKVRFNCKPIPPTKAPTVPPTKKPTVPPTAPPTDEPTASPTASPTEPPTDEPTASPTASPTKPPTGKPTASPTASPTEPPTDEPTVPPTDEPTASPTVRPTKEPTVPPTAPPTPVPTDFNWNDWNTNDNETLIIPNMTVTPVFLQNNTEYFNLINLYNGTELFNEANSSCINAGRTEGTPLYQICMFDVLTTGNPAIAIDGAIINFLSCQAQNNDSHSCANGTILNCPDACNAHGKCMNGLCQCDKNYQGASCADKIALLTDAELAGVISTAAVVGIAIGAAAFIVLTGVGAKKGYDYLHNKDHKMGGLHANPLYQENTSGGENPFYNKA